MNKAARDYLKENRILELLSLRVMEPTSPR